MKRLSRAAMNAQHGQALTEFLVIALVLVPLFLTLPLIAKYQDIAQATELAARYVAFDGMTHNDASGNWKSPVQLSGEVQRRFFSNPNAAIKTGDTPGDFKAHQNLFWRDPNDRSLIRNFGSDVRVSFGQSLNDAADRGSAFSNTSDGQPFLLRNALGLRDRGIYRGNVTVTLANLSPDLIGPTKSYDMFKNINLTMTRHTDLVVDPWAARSPDQVVSKLNNVLVFPGSELGPMRDSINLLVMFMEWPRSFPALCTACRTRIGELDYWRDEVPDDRKR